MVVMATDLSTAFVESEIIYKCHEYYIKVFTAHFIESFGCFTGLGS